VHYIHFRLTPEQIEMFETGPVEIATIHPEYRYSTAISDETRATLLEDLRG
jgi:hypothetical protein